MNGQQPKLPIAMLAEYAAKQPNKVYWQQPVDRQYRETTWAQAYQQTLRLAAGLRGLGLQPGDKVALLSQNCAEWFLCDFAITAAGLISVPIYFTAGEKTISYVLEHCEARAVVIGKLDNIKPVQASMANINNTPAPITLGMHYQSMPCDHQIEDLIAANEPLQDVATPDMDDVFSISYTSGSTGNPKGVVLTFRNIIFGAYSVLNMPNRPSEDRVVSYLPLAHITERALIEYASLYGGGRVSFIESQATFIEDLRNARVTSFLSVPRLWMKFQANVLAAFPQAKLDVLLRIPLVNRIVKAKIREKLGLKYAVSCGSGSAPVAPSILQWYHKIGVPMSEGWGMTELTGMASSQYPFRADKIGTIGIAIDGLEVALSDQGEMLVRGDAVFKEYFKDPKTTAETFTEDGWMRTGDRAAIDADGYLTITGRVKELFKSGKGKYVAPVPIECLLLENQLIEQICVMGSGLPQPVAVLLLSAETSKGLDKTQIEQSLQQTLTKVNQRLEKHEHISSLCIAQQVWDIDNGLLTPTLKIKRDALEKKYVDWVSTEGLGAVVWES